jgi:membrane protease YdiL (CAAX protease family)
VLLLVVEEALIGLAFLGGDGPGDLMLWVGGPALTAVLGSVVYRHVTGRSIWGARRCRWSDLGWGVLVGLLILVVDTALGFLFDLVVTDQGAPVQGWIDDAMAATPLLVGLGVAVATPFGEEVVVRGVLLRGLEARTSRWVAVAVSSLIFGLLHLENLDPLGWLHVTSATIAGVLFALALIRSGHLIAAVTAHVVVNGVYTVVGLFTAGAGMLTIGPAGDVPTIDLDVGSCAVAEWWDGDALDAASEVDCDEPHDVEVAHRERLDAGAEVTLDQVADDADVTCLEAFERYVDQDWETSAFDYVTALPDEERWADGDRELVCLVVPWEDDEFTEPARGSGR